MKASKLTVVSGPITLVLERPSDADRQRFAPSTMLEDGIGAIGDVPEDLRDLFVIMKVMLAQVKELKKKEGLIGNSKNAAKMIKREELNPLLEELRIFSSIFWKELKAQLELLPKLCDCGIDLRADWKVVSNHAVKIHQILEAMGAPKGFKDIKLSEIGIPCSSHSIKVIDRGGMEMPGFGNMMMSGLLGGTRGSAIPAELLEMLSEMEGHGIHGMRLSPLLGNLRSSAVPAHVLDFLGALETMGRSGRSGRSGGRS